MRKVAVVTGAGGGIGVALAERLVAAGYEIAMGDIDPDTLHEAVLRCAALRPGARISSAVVDVADRAALDRFAAAVRADHVTDHVDVLFNNAGVGGGERVLSSTAEGWDRTFAITWGGVYHSTRAFLPLLVAAPSGLIVNIASINAARASLGRGSQVDAAATANCAIRGFTESLHRDLEAHAAHVRACLVRWIAHSHDESTAGWNVTAAQAADQIIRGIHDGRRRIVVGPAAGGIDRMARWFPEAIDRLPDRLLPKVAVAGAPLLHLRTRFNGRRRVA
jgi:NAD(P)-dependent dehydrogenase (short-subunit alcohol dehydrogenase family)